MDYSFHRQSLEALWPELDPLLERHWREIAHYQDIELSVDKAAYGAMEKAGAAHTFVVRDGFGALVGYAVFFVRPHLHYSKHIHAYQDVVYVVPELRSMGIGLDFLMWCDKQLKELGVEVVLHHAKVAHPELGRALVKMGYELIDQIYGKRL